MRQRQHILRHIRYLTIFVMGGFFLGCSMPVQHGLSEKEANEIIVLLSKAQPPIDATKTKDESGREVMWTIVVPKSDAPKAIAMLQENNLPKRKEKGMNELYSETGMIPTDTQERARYIMAISGDLIRTFKSIKGVIKARVHLAIPKEKSIRRPGEKIPDPKASVLLIVQPDEFKTFQVKEMLKKQVREIVMGSHEQLETKNIHVVIRDSSGGLLATSPTTGPTSDLKHIVFVKVAAADAMKLRAFIIGSFALIGLLLILCVVLFFRSSSLKQQLNANNF